MPIILSRTPVVSTVYSQYHLPLETAIVPAILFQTPAVPAENCKFAAEVVAAGNTALDPYTFDYLLLCNKICGSSHYNMQMKIVVDSPEDYKAWLSDKVALVKEVKASNEPAPAAEATNSDSTVVSTDTVASKVAMK